MALCLKQRKADDASQGLDPRKENLIVVGFMGHHSYGKLKHFGQVKTTTQDH